MLGGREELQKMAVIVPWLRLDSGDLPGDPQILMVRRRLRRRLFKYLRENPPPPVLKLASLKF